MTISQDTNQVPTNLTERLAQDTGIAIAKHIVCTKDEYEDLKIELMGVFAHYTKDLITKQEVEERMAAVAGEIHQSITRMADEYDRQGNKGKADGCYNAAMLASEHKKCNTTEIMARRDKRIAGDASQKTVMLYSCSHNMWYSQCSICSPESVRLTALEEAAKARCNYCQRNLRVEHQGQGNNYWHWDEAKGGFILPCKASPIRALMDSND